MNHIEQAYEQGLRIREKRWDENFWIKKYSYNQSIDENGNIWYTNWNFNSHFNKWEIWHKDLLLLKDQTDIKAQIQTCINQIQELLKQL